MESADFVIIGGGSAGCVLANRLSADPATGVVLLEAGPADDWRAWSVHMPAAYGINFQGGPYTRSFHTEPEAQLFGRKVYQPRGKILGGSSGINGMCYTRCSPLDYQRWVTEGAQGWSYAEVLPYFKKLESSDSGDDLYRGRSGPVRVKAGPWAFASYDAFQKAGEQAGYPLTPDINGYQQEGFGRFERNVDHGIRASASWAYLRPVRHRKNLRVKTGATVVRILFEGTKAVGVEYRQGVQVRKIRAEREVLLCAGAINSPQILQVSGIGEPAHLKELGVATVAALRGVGQNLQDHYEFYLSWICPDEMSLNRHLGPLGKAKIGLEWILTRKGFGESNHCEGVAFVKSEDSLGYPDVQFQFMPLQLADGLSPKSKPGGFCITIAHQRPKNRGHVKARSLDVDKAPEIVLNYLSTDYDLAKARRCIEIVRDVIARPAFDSIRGKEMKPGAEISSRQSVEQFCRETGTSGYHASGTCRMGSADNPDAVVSATGKVFGVENLRVVDGSIIPSLTTGNTNAPIMMMAEKLADDILGVPPLVPIHAPFAGELKPDM